MVCIILYIIIRLLRYRLLYPSNRNTTATTTDAIAAGVGKAVVPRSGRAVAELYHLVSCHDVWPVALCRLLRHA